MHTIEIYESVSNYVIKSITRFCFPLQLYYEPAAFTAYDNYIYINNIIKSQKKHSVIQHTASVISGAVRVTYKI